jgi:putative DNA methylase
MTAQRNTAKAAHPAFPVTIYYAFKQSEQDHNGGATGWETFLKLSSEPVSVLQDMANANRTRHAQSELTLTPSPSSIVLVCRPRPMDAPVTSRRDFLTALKREMPSALRHLQ